MLISSIKECPSGTYVIRLDDESEVKSTLEVISDLRLFSGKELDEKQLEELKTESAKRLTLKKASELVSLRMMSGSELKDKLIHKGYDVQSVDYSVDRLYELGLLNDSEYAAAVVRHYAAKGYGEARIRAELSRRGINREFWDECLEAMPESDDKLDRYISLHLKNPEDVNQQKKVSSALYRRGYSWEEIKAAMQRFTEEDY